MSESHSPWWVVLASGAISAVGLWINARGGWAATRATTADRVAEREAADRARVVSTMDARQTALMDRQDREVERLNRRCEECEADRDRGWDLARAWRTCADDLWHELNNARMAAGDPRPPRLPGLEEIEPERPREGG